MKKLLLVGSIILILTIISGCEASKYSGRSSSKIQETNSTWQHYYDRWLNSGKIYKYEKEKGRPLTDEEKKKYYKNWEVAIPDGYCDPTNPLDADW